MRHVLLLSWEECRRCVSAVFIAGRSCDNCVVKDDCYVGDIVQEIGTMLQP